MDFSMNCNSFPGSLLRAICLLVLFGNFFYTECSALSERFYDEYIESHSFLRGGIGVRAANALYRRQENMMPQPSCVWGQVKGAVNDLLLCTIRYDAIPEVSTSTIAPTPTPASDIPQIHGASEMTREPRYDETQAFFNKADYTISRKPDQLGVPRGEHRKWEMNFEQSARADSAFAFASISFSYDIISRTAAIAALHTAYIGPWASSTFAEIVYAAPFSRSDAEARWIATAGFAAAAKNLESICQMAITIPPEGINTAIIEAIPASSTIPEEFTLQGTFSGTMEYNSVTASWIGYWGPYEQVAKYIPINYTFYGVDGTYSNSIREKWNVEYPFHNILGSANEVELVRYFAKHGPFWMIRQVYLWSSDWFKGQGQLRSYPDRIEVQNSEAIQSASGVTYNIPIMAADRATIVVPAVTEIVTKTKTHTNTLIPLFGRMAAATGKKTLAEKRGSSHSFNRSWVIGLYTVCCVLVIIALGLGWSHIADFGTRVKPVAPEDRRTESERKLDSSSWNILPKFPILPKIRQLSPFRKSSGSELIDRAKLYAMRNRGSKESFETIQLG